MTPCVHCVIKQRLRNFGFVSMAARMCCATSVWEPRYCTYVQHVVVHTTRQVCCVVSPDLYAGTPRSRAYNTCWVVISSITEGFRNLGRTSRHLVRDCAFMLISKRLQRIQAAVFMVLYPGCVSLCCCKQTRRQSSAGPDISLLRPELQQQWHHARNEHLGDRKVSASSRLSVWWSCDKCPCGFLHEWLASVGHRQNMDYQCPYCTNKRLCHHNTLMTTAPAAAIYWDTAKNGLTPDQVTAHSNARRHWLCPLCGYSWQTPLHGRVRKNSGCPKCSRIRRAVNKKTILTQSQHPAMMEFDSERNRKAGLDPDNITAGSDKKVHWICLSCPKGQPHLFTATPGNRVGLNSGCPYCTSKKACICNSLQSLYPALAAEYDSAKNGAGPEQVLPGSQKKAFWKDASGHTWEQSPFQRIQPERTRIKRASIKSRLEKQA